MKATTQLEVIDGKITKTETISYKDGSITKRFYDNVYDVVPSGTILLSKGPVGTIPISPLDRSKAMVLQNNSEC